MFSLRSLFYQLYRITGHFNLTHWLEHLQSKLLWIKMYLKCILIVKIIHMLYFPILPGDFLRGFSLLLNNLFKKIVRLLYAEFVPQSSLLCKNK